MRPSPRARKERKGTHSSCTCEALCTSYFQDFWCLFFDARPSGPGWQIGCFPKCSNFFGVVWSLLSKPLPCLVTSRLSNFCAIFIDLAFFTILMGFTLTQGCDAKMSYFSLCNRAPVPMSRSRERTMKARHCRRCL